MRWAAVQARTLKGGRRCLAGMRLGRRAEKREVGERRVGVREEEDWAEEVTGVRGCNGRGWSWSVKANRPCPARRKGSGERQGVLGSVGEGRVKGARGVC